MSIHAMRSSPHRDRHRRRGFIPSDSPRLTVTNAGDARSRPEGSGAAVRGHLQCRNQGGLRRVARPRPQLDGHRSRQGALRRSLADSLPQPPPPALRNSSESLSISACGRHTFGPVAVASGLASCRSVSEAVGSMLARMSTRYHGDRPGASGREVPEFLQTIWKRAGAFVGCGCDLRAP